MKKQIRKAMICTIAMMVAAIVSLTGVTYAWFTMGTDATVDGIDLTLVSSNGGIYVSTASNPTEDDPYYDDIKWKFYVNLDLSVQNMKPASTSSDTLSAGNLTFYDGVLNDELTKVTASGVAVDNDGENDEYFIKQDLYLKPVDASAESTTVYFNPTISTESAASLASQALRIAIVSQGDYVLGTDITNLSAGDAKANVSVCEFSPNTHHSTTSGYIQTFPVKSAGEFDIDATSATSDKLASVTTYNSDFTTYKYPSFTIGQGKCHKVTVYMWFEGQDIDCTNDIAATGIEAISLSFDTVNPAESNTQS